MTVSPTLANSDDQTPLLTAASDRNDFKKPTPLPKVQICVLLLSILVEPIASQCIYPFVNQVSPRCRAWVPYSLYSIQLIREMDITDGDETQVGEYYSRPGHRQLTSLRYCRLGYYAGMIVRKDYGVVTCYWLTR